MWWMMLAVAEEPVQLMVAGETLAVYHGAYCSYPRVPGVTTKPKDVRPPEIQWDFTFDIANTRDFTGVTMGAPAFAASPLNLRGDIASPEFPLVRSALAACAPHLMDRPAMEELLRKSTPPQRSLLIRHLINHELREHTCARTHHENLMKHAGTCQEGKCGDLLDLLAVAGARCR